MISVKQRVRYPTPNLLSEYSRYLSPPLSVADIHDLRKRLASADIQLANEHTLIASIKSRPKTIMLQSIGVRPVKVQARGALTTYRVQIGTLLMHIQLLNISRKVDTGNRQPIYMNSPRSTCVLMGRTADYGEVICKRFYFSDQTYALRGH